ncbi:MAG TPA: hypothetical protein VF717_17115 [Pyrinomonadaceae bacterium]|jgi:hypothetical protein
METRTQISQGTQDELVRRHRLAAMVTRAFLVLTVALIAVAFTGRAPRVGSGNPDPVLVAFLRIGIVVLGVGAVTLRRTRFAAMRLQDIAALRGISGMLATLQNTTVQVAALGGLISILGFFLMMLTADPSNMVFIGIAALAVLIYCYPRRAAWQRVVHGIQQSGDANDTPAKGRVA